MELGSAAAKNIEAHPRAAIVDIKIAGNGRLELSIEHHRAKRLHSVPVEPQTGTAFSHRVTGRERVGLWRMTHVLVIDDDEQIRELLRETLERDGYEVVTASNGAEGIRLHCEHSADLIITDILMPVKEGLATIHKLRSQFPEVKIIAITGGGHYGPLSHYLGMASQIGANRVIAKPFVRRQMLDVIGELMVESESTEPALTPIV